MLDMSQINIRENLMVALGYSDHLHDQIDKVFNDRPLEYYELYKESPLYNSSIFNTYTTRKNEAMRKITGIYLWDQKNNEHQTTFSFIKKGYKISWDYFQQRRLHSIINFQEFGKYYFQVVERKKADQINNELLFHHHKIILLYLCWFYNKPYDLQNPIGEILLSEMFFQKVTAEKVGVKLKDEEQLMYEELRDRLYKKYSISEKQTKFTLQDIIIRIHLNQMKEIKEREGALISRSAQLDELRMSAYQEGINKHFTSLLRSIKMLGINADDFISSCVMTKAEIDRLFHQYVLNKLSNSLDEEEEDAHISALFIMYAFIQEYKRTKDIYFHRMKEEHFKEITEFKLKLERKEEEIHKKHYELNQKEAKMKEEMELLKQELERTKKLNREYEYRLTAAENDRKEILSLREYLFHSDQNDYKMEYDENRINERIEALKKIKAAVIGGHPRWQQKLKEEFPQFHFINPDHKGVDLSFIDGLDIVFFNTATNAHSFYEKLMKRLRNNNTSLHYINHNHNFELTIENMYRGMNRLHGT